MGELLGGGGGGGDGGGGGGGKGYVGPPSQIIGGVLVPPGPPLPKPMNIISCQILNSVNVHSCHK